MTDHSNRRLTVKERTTLFFLQYAPWLAFIIIALPAPLYFLFRYFNAATGSEAGEFMLVAMSTLAGGAILGLFVVVLLFLYRRQWEKKLRDRLAANGVTSDELQWFEAELTKAERRTLREIEGRNLLLADAYRDTLAARLTATRVAANAKREAVAVERRMQNSTQLEASGRATLEQELRSDRERLKRIEAEATERRAQAEARLLMIEAEAGRNANDEETRIALQRLEFAEAQVPYPLESARLEREAREQLDQELRASRQIAQGETDER
ncbi:MAG TPA: hypothetical protein VGX24_14825 [Pyrinomonadaceae bacterium]|jgi:hypothetical protein|nr:hypothetical protein [Pyrinomonadaceae bacterium]